MEEMNQNKIQSDDHLSDRAKRLKSEDSDPNLNTFLEWCNSNGIIINFDKVKITKESTSNNYGMIAIEDIGEDEVLATIPKSILLEPKNTKINELIQNSADELKTESNWSKLTISLMHECSNPASKWAPYLNMFPNYENLDLPMFWDETLVSELLGNTCVERNIKVDLVKMKKEFNEIIVPFIQKNMQFFSEKCLSFDYYKNIVAFIMSYSFRDPSEDQEDSKSTGPMMVPVADILNAVAKNNAHLRFEDNELTIVSTKAIKKGEEVMNTYGENSNTDLLHMYGYVEQYPENIFDCVEIPTKCFTDAYNKLSTDSEELMNKKIEIFKELDFIDDNMSFIVGVDGILNEEECLHMLQIYSMKSSELKEFIENDYELLEDEEWDEFSLSNENLNKLPIDWKTFLNDCCELHLLNLKQNEMKLNNEKLPQFETDTKNKKRVTNALTLINGHIALLNNMMKSLQI